MKLSRRQFGAGATAAAVALGVGGRASAQSPLLLKFSHVTTADTPKGRGADRFKELAEKYTNGAVKVEVYPNSTLLKDREELEALQLGAVHFLAPSTAKFAPLGVKEFEALDLPFLFPDDATYDRVIKGPVGQKLLAMLETKGIKGLAFWDNGFHMVSANRPLKEPKDFQGLKMRISGSKVADAYFRLVGALPQIMAFSELYQALQTGVCDGCENTPSNYLTQKLHEVQKNITVSNHGHLQYTVIANAGFWNKLPDNVRKPLEQAINEATEFTNSIAQKDNQDAFKAIVEAKTSEIYNLTPENRKLWVDAMLPTYDKMRSRVGGDIIDELRREVGSKA